MKRLALLLFLTLGCSSSSQANLIDGDSSAADSSGTPADASDFESATSETGFDGADVGAMPGPDADATVDVAPRELCPSVAPAEGDVCDLVSYECSYPRPSGCSAWLCSDEKGDSPRHFAPIAAGCSVTKEQCADGQTCSGSSFSQCIVDCVHRCRCVDGVRACSPIVCGDGG